MTTYQVRCTHCNRVQNCKTDNVSKYSKKCVFCGKSFKIQGHILGVVE